MDSVDFKEQTGFDTPAEMNAYELGKADAQMAITKYIHGFNDCLQGELSTKNPYRKGQQ